LGIPILNISMHAVSIILRCKLISLWAIGEMLTHGSKCTHQSETPQWREYMYIRHFPRPYRPEKAQRFSHSYDQGDDNEWCIIKAFYLALHVAGIAYEARNNCNLPSSHFETRVKFRDHTLMPNQICLAYERLYALAHKARYSISQPNEISDLEAEDAHQQLQNILIWARTVCPTHIPR
jgi:hypothetical protein